MDPAASGDRSEYCFFDLETTKPQPPDQRCYILEFGAILVCPRRLVELESYSSLVRPDDLSSVSLDDARHKGITRDDLLGAPSFSEIADRVYDFLHGRIWVGHYIENFDCIRIWEAFEKIGRTPPEHNGIIDSWRLLTERFGMRTNNMKLATLARYFQIGEQKHRSLEDVRLNLEVIKCCAAVLLLESSLPDMLTAGFLKPDEVSITSISASLIPRYLGTDQIQLLHNDVALQLFCPCLRVRYEIHREKFFDHARRPRLSFVVDASPSLCMVLYECDAVAKRFAEDYGSQSEWRPAVARYPRHITARLHIRRNENGDIDTEIYKKESSGTVRQLVFGNSDVASLFRTGISVDACFSLETYDYQQGAGILLVAKKLVVHSD